MKRARFSPTGASRMRGIKARPPTSSWCRPITRSWRWPIMFLAGICCSNSTLPVRPRELVVLRTSWHQKADYEWHYHVGYALQIGMTLEEIVAVKDGPDAGNWNEQDRAVLSAVDELLKQNSLSDATWAALGRHFDQHQVMDLVFTIGNYVMLSWTIAAFGVQLEGHVNKIGFDLKTETGAPPATGERPGESKNWAANNAAKGKKV